MVRCLRCKAGNEWIEGDVKARNPVAVGWIQELADGRKCFYEGDLDPRDVHDNGKPCYRVYRHDDIPSAEEKR